MWKKGKRKRGISWELAIVEGKWAWVGGQYTTLPDIPARKVRLKGGTQTGLGGGQKTC